MAVSRADLVVSIPRPITSLLGREQELNQLYSLLRSDVRLVTITGFGGIGKTRLSLQAALELEPIFDAGAIFLPMAAVTQGRSMPIAIARTIGLDDSIDTVEAVAEALGTSPRLLVLDNLEQIPDAATVVLDILTAMPQVTILTTSRSRLEISGEHVVPLDPVQIEPAVQLFTERALAANPALQVDDAIITEICNLLDGIPLAIELAAARAAIFSLTDLRQQLEKQLPILASNRADLPVRQRTMRNAIAWTYDLLSPIEQRLFNWISVYEPDISLESIHHIAHQLELAMNPLDLVQMLVSRSLLRPGREQKSSPRYQMLQMLREFGHEQLQASNQDTLARHSHGMDMVTLAERAEPHLVTSESIRWTSLLNDDLPNLYASLEWSNQSQHHATAQRIFGAIWRYFENIGHVNRVLEYVPDTSDGTADEHSRARALWGIGYLNERIRNLQTALIALKEAKDLAENLPDQVMLVRVLQGLGTVMFDYSDVPMAQKYLREAKELSERIDDARGQMTSTGQLAIIEIQLGNFDAAITGNQEVLRIAEDLGDAISIASIHLNIGLCYQNLQQYETAEESYERALAVAQEADDINGICIAYANLSGNNIKLNRPERCLEYGEKGLVIAREIGLSYLEATLLINISSVAHQQGDFGTSAITIAQASRLLNYDGGEKEQIHFASVLTELCMNVGMRTEAAELLGSVFAMRKKLQVHNREFRADAEDEALADLDPENNANMAAAMARGAELDREDLVALIQKRSREIIAISPPKTPEVKRSEQPKYHLTPRETEVLTMVATGLTNAEIADEMFVSLRTITTHVSNILTKLDVNNRARAVALATQAGLV